MWQPCLLQAACSRVRWQQSRALAAVQDRILHNQPGGLQQLHPCMQGGNSTPSTCVACQTDTCNRQHRKALLGCAACAALVPLLAGLPSSAGRVSACAEWSGCQLH